MITAYARRKMQFWKFDGTNLGGRGLGGDELGGGGDGKGWDLEKKAITCIIFLWNVKI